MPRYTVKFNDGTQTEIGAPGPDSEKIRNTVTAQAEKASNKKVVSLQQVKAAPKKTTGKKKAAAKPAKAASKGKTKGKAKAKVTQKLVTKKVGSKVKSIAKTSSAQKSSNKKVIKSASIGKDQASLKGQLNSLENTLRVVVKDLSSQINTLRNAILVSRRRELLSELDDIESQI